MKGLDWYIAQRYLASRGGRLLSLITWIALGGVTVGVTALIVVIGVMNGMQEDLRAKILGSTAHVIVLEQGNALRMRDYPRILDSVLTVPEVTAAAPFILSQVTIIRGDYSQSADMYGISLDTTRVPPTDMERQILSGELDLEPTGTGLPPLLLGSGFADRMQLFRGDTIVVASFENLATDVFGGLMPTLRQFEVTGTFTTGMYDYDTRNVYTSLETAQELLGLEEGVASGIGVRTADPEIAPDVAADLQERLGFPYYVESWITTNRALFSALKLEKLAMGLILYLIILVAAFNIISTLVMVVAERTREIGILKAMGMTRQGILRIFILQGVWIGVIGTLMGTVMGLALCWILDRYEIIRIPPDVYFVDRLPVSVQGGDVLLIVAASVLVAFAATIYPSLQAARLEPVDAIRHE
ncbi:MAG: ABC transporter permease [Gemmatimonadetes bacterium]|nr:ABC transporter permease [Gemmatimonadota bacterium]